MSFLRVTLGILIKQAIQFCLSEPDVMPKIINFEQNYSCDDLEDH